MRLTGIAPLIARMRLVVFVALMMFASIAAANEFRLPEDRIEAFLELLPGFWQGEAIETPVGSMAYDMLFHSCGDGALAGVAKTEPLSTIGNSATVIRISRLDFSPHSAATAHLYF